MEQEIGRLAEELAPRHGMNRRQFLASSAGMSAAFVAMNTVFGPLFNASTAEAATPGMAEERARKLAGQFIFDCQTHFVRDDYGQEGITGLAQFAKQFWNPALANEKSIDRMKFANYVKEIYVDSDTKVALLSGSPVDDPFNLFLNNDQIIAARTSVNTIARSRRMLAHSIIQPMSDGWLDEVDRCIETLKPDSWKGYTIGDPIFLTKKGSNWRLDDEKRVYPFYEKCVKSGITTVCIHKGLMPADYEKSWPEVWKTRHGVGSRQGREGLAADHVHHLSLGAASVHRTTRRVAQAVRGQRPHRLGHRPGGDPAEVRREECARRTRHLLREHLRHASAARRRDGRHAHQGSRPGQGGLGHGLGVVRLAAVADRSHAPARDTRRHAEEARLQAAGRRGRAGQERDLRGQRRAGTTSSIPKTAQTALDGDDISAMRAHWAGDRSNLRYGYVA